MAKRMFTISPLIVAGGALVRLAGLWLMQHVVGMNLIDLWRHWLFQLMIG